MELIYLYLTFSYLYMLGWRIGVGDDTLMSYLSVIFAPIFMPLFLGFKYSPE